jgi:pimeloyl-ACP methyl ester carboxylesterase
MATSCDGVRAVDPLPVEEVFSAPLLAAARAGRWEDVPPWGCYLAENSPSHTSVPRSAATPFLVVQGELDDLVPAFAERADVAALCADGYEIEYLECAGGGHSVADVQTVFYLLDWIDARLAGEPLPAERTCVVGAPVSCAGL